MVSTEVHLSPQEWLARCRRGGARLLLEVKRAPRLNERLAIRVRLDHAPVAVTVVGTAASVNRDGDGYRIELAPDADSAPRIRALTAAAQGAPTRFLERAVRYLVKMPVMVGWRGAQVCASTLSVSSGGCAIRWTGPLPGVGEPLQLRFGAGARAAGLRGLVCWRDASAAASTAGIRFLLGGTPVELSALLAEMELSGAPRA